METFKGLTLEELEGQDAQLLPDRIEMRRRRRRRPQITNIVNNEYITNTTVNNSVTCDLATNTNGAGTQCSSP